MTTKRHDDQILFQNLSTGDYSASGLGVSASALAFANSFSIGSASTVSLNRTLEMGSPTAANCAAVLMTFINDLLGKR